MRFLIAFFLLIMGTGFSHAFNAEPMVKGMENNKDWSSFAIADPIFGLVFGTRAGTESNRFNSTLTVSYVTEKKCLPDISIVVKADSDLEIISSERYGTLQFDNKPAYEVYAVLTKDKGSKFAFLTIEGKALDVELIKNKQLMINFMGFGVNYFSLSGASGAIIRAKKICEQFRSDK